jgi:hypothetical protein
MPRRLALLSFALAACTGAPPPPAGGGPPTADGGAVLDAGLPDAGPPDAGTPPDAGVLPDAGTPPDAGAGSPDAGPAGDGGPARYPSDSVLSPVTEHTAAAWRTLRAAAGEDLRDDVFMKVGASGTVSTLLLYCFAGNPSYPYEVDLAGRDELRPTIDHFRAGDAAGRTSFDRASLAAEVGRGAGWATSGSPSPVEKEIAAIRPRFAFVNYGTNDMGLGTTPQSALWPFFENMSRLLDTLEGRGILSIVTGLNPRSDSEAMARWVPTYNAVTRGIAESRELPYIDLFLASSPLPNLGLVADGIHGNTYRDTAGRAQPCVFTAPGLGFNYNNRNLASLETLDLVRRVVLEGAAAPARTAGWPGSGAPSDPFVIDTLPYTHAFDTRASLHRRFDRYPSCDSGQDESGPEVLYRLDLPRATYVRAMVFDRAGVDIDLHLLGAAATAESCVARHDRILQRRLEAGTHHFALDTYVTTTPQAGPYLFVVVECEPGDAACGS